jgi:outer membrane murein-binding lipoprotein Lpp
MATIPCYRCGHPLDVAFGNGKTPDVCPNCGQNFAAHSPSVFSRGTRDDEAAKSEMSTRNASAIAVLLAVIAGVVKAGTGAGANDPAVAAGQALGSAFALIALAFLLAVICATICLAFGKKFRRTLNRSYSLIAIILASLLLVGAVVGKVTGRTAGKMREQEEAAAAVAKDLDAVREAVRVATETGNPIELDLAPASDANTEAGRIQHVARMSFQAFADLQNAYLKDMVATGFDTLLDPDRVAKDEGLKESREILAKSKAVTAAHREKFTEHVRTFPDKIKNLPDSPASDPEWFRGFQQGFQRNGQRAMRIWELEMQAVDKVGEVIEILAAAEGKWHPENGSFMFEEEADLEKFNAVLQEAAALGAEQEKLREEAFSRGKAGLEKLAD